MLPKITAPVTKDGEAKRGGRICQYVWKWPYRAGWWRGLTFWSHIFGIFGINKRPLSHPTGGCRTWIGAKSGEMVQGFSATLPTWGTVQRQLRQGEMEREVRITMTWWKEASGILLELKILKGSFFFSLFLGSQHWRWVSPQDFPEGQQSEHKCSLVTCLPTHSKKTCGQKKRQTVEQFFRKKKKKKHPHPPSLQNTIRADELMNHKNTSCVALMQAALSRCRAAAGPAVWHCLFQVQLQWFLSQLGTQSVCWY